jgi:hypothetical protein
MHPPDLLLPCVAMVALTALVWVRLYVVRIGEMRANRISAQSLATSQQAADRLQRVNAADNFRNLFEVPVLFYALCLALPAASAVSSGFIAGAWLYVTLRGLHSLIHCTYNKVLHRFLVYVASTLLLFGMWAALGVKLLTAR